MRLEAIRCRDSAVGQHDIAVLADDATFGDPHEVPDAMVDAFTLIRQAAGVPPEIQP